ncbi:cobaltochelatase subunit CobN [Synechococcus sp. PCC 6312]|uniref:cobaltochelatase subunit CobN n=1 Tax=Synechococcus sp. (strain ATCC 27167 / PCC 6312) TaxID=195253 RepID=UPI00029EFF6E|nr:cobaltochelatase subunit CobN [Synechococcus sp. PCC 6312]AFY62629.1 cobaltochelatase CobN subunit [Synechococcus sp. PCC 6312]
MHRIVNLTNQNVTNSNGETVNFIRQTPAPIFFLTTADTDIHVLSQAWTRLPQDFPTVRVMNYLNLQQQIVIDDYAEAVLAQAEVIVLRLLGGRAYWSYGLEVLQTTVADSGAKLIVLPGDDRPDLELMSLSSLPLEQVDQLWRYFLEGGVENMTQALLFLGFTCLDTPQIPALPQPVPRVGIMAWNSQVELAETAPKVGILFYRAHYLAGNTAPITALCQALSEKGLQPIPVYAQSLQDETIQAELLKLLAPNDTSKIDLILNTTSFSIARLDLAQTDTERGLEFWQALDVPVIQVILSGSGLATWQEDILGLSPRDLAMNVVLPEVDGRIISRAISFKSGELYDQELETAIIGYQPEPSRIDFVAELAAHWGKLRRLNNADKKVALILANYPAKDGRIANGVGLDTPASCVKILHELKASGYDLGAQELPNTGDELIQQLMKSITHDPESCYRPVNQSFRIQEYKNWFKSQSETIQQKLETYYPQPQQDIPIPGLVFGNIFIGIQPPRGNDLDPNTNYHNPELLPTPNYLSFYLWIRHSFQANAVIHIGKHGNLEWLPGKSVALSNQCFPELALGPLPNFYPFIVNDPGEGCQAKRRSQAVIIDHLTPPMTQAGLYGPLDELSQVLDEYYEAEQLDPPRLPLLKDRIDELIKVLHLDQDLAHLAPAESGDWQAWLNQTDGYLCELRDAQIRDGLHILGQCPENSQLRDLIFAIARSPNRIHLGLTRSLAIDLGFDCDPLTTPATEPSPDPKFRTVGDWTAALDHQASLLIDRLLTQDVPTNLGRETNKVLAWIADSLLPNLRRTNEELTQLLRGLDGCYIPSGPSGAPTRGRPDVLPTGRNFYAVDLRAIPTEVAWDLGRKAAEAVIERYTQEQGEFPKTLGLSVWGTATMRTGGDDIAEALALLGVMPVWDGPSRRVVDLDVIPFTLLGRPRVDVTLRISGFFRDAFPNLIQLFDDAVNLVASLNEPPEQNPLAAHVQTEITTAVDQGINLTTAETQARLRIFGSPPGAYGAGLQGLIDNPQAWNDTTDLAQAYINWSSTAYTGTGQSQPAPKAFQNRLAQMQIVLHNQDNREHDLLDSDDYYQFQGGLTAAVNLLNEQAPTVYFGDHGQTENPKIRALTEELARVYRSRVINPKWIAGVMRHGYKGATELAATVDFLFGFAATTQTIPNHMFAGVAQAYVFDPVVQDFLQAKNPHVLRDIAERLLEAEKRGLWTEVEPSCKDQLRAILHQAEAKIETYGVT